MCLVVLSSRKCGSYKQQYKNTFLLLLLSFLDPDRDIGHQQRQLATELLTGPVVSNQARFCLDSCTPFPQVVSTSHRVFPFFSQYHLEDSIAQLVGSMKIHLFAGGRRFIQPHLCLLMITSICCKSAIFNIFILDIVLRQ